MNKVDKYPEPIVAACIFNTKEEMFLMKSVKHDGRYIIPGGHEETGLSIYDIELLTLFDYLPTEKEYHKKVHMIFLNFRARTNDESVILNNEAIEYIWTEPKKAFRLNLEKYTKKTIENYLL